MFEKWVLILSSSLLILSLPIKAEIFKCNIEGKQIYQDIPCADGVDQSKVQIIIQNDNSKKYHKYEPEPYDPAEFGELENSLIRDKKVAVGMSVRALQFSWGYPKKINRSAYGPAQWVFQDGIYQRYAYVKDGVVVNWQD